MSSSRLCSLGRLVFDRRVPLDNFDQVQPGEEEKCNPPSSEGDCWDWSGCKLIVRTLQSDNRLVEGRRFKSLVVDLNAAPDHRVDGRVGCRCEEQLEARARAR